MCDESASFLIRYCLSHCTSKQECASWCYYSLLLCHLTKAHVFQTTVVTNIILINFQLRLKICVFSSHKCNYHLCCGNCIHFPIALLFRRTCKSQRNEKNVYTSGMWQLFFISIQQSSTIDNVVPALSYYQFSMLNLKTCLKR